MSSFLQCTLIADSWPAFLRLIFLTYNVDAWAAVDAEFRSYYCLFSCYAVTAFRVLFPSNLGTYLLNDDKLLITWLLSNRWDKGFSIRLGLQFLKVFTKCFYSSCLNAIWVDRFWYLIVKTRFYFIVLYRCKLTISHVQLCIITLITLKLPVNRADKKCAVSCHALSALSV